jgi:2'-deoxynucleoside 5'-phosphate N-hydrolase
MTAYISISFAKKKSLDSEVTAIKKALTEFGITPFVFVEAYNFDREQEKDMMTQAMHDIDGCGLLIAETSEKGIGIGIEVGYAKAKKKPVIYVRSKMAEHSTTVSGISDFQIIYSDSSDLQHQLIKVLMKLNLP